MCADFSGLAGTQDRTPARTSERGFSALELLVIIVIICVVVAVAVPALHSKARASVLVANVQNLGQLVTEQAMEGYYPEYRPSGAGDSTVYLSTHLEESLSTAGDAGYVNPIVGSAQGRTVLNSSAAPTDPQSVAPAVFITDSQAYQYASFSGRPETSRRLLAGSLIIAFNTDARSVDVFFVDSEGQRSADLVSVPTG